MSKATEDVLAERRRQVDVEDFGASYDDMATSGQLAAAAACYAIKSTANVTMHAAAVKIFWPWAGKWWKPTTPRRNLVKAAALLIAEVERIDRVAARTTTGTGGDHAD